MATTITGAEEVHWDLTDLYSGADDPRLDSDIEDALARAKQFSEKYHGKVADLGPEELAQGIADLENIQEVLYRASVFAYLHFSTDTADAARGALLQKVQEKYSALQTQLLFFTLEWVELDDDRAQRIVTDHSLQKYRHFLESARRFKQHVLSEPEEKILSEKTVSGSAAWSRLFTEVTSAMRIDLEGEELTLETAMAKLHQPDRDIRRKSGEAISKALVEGLRTRSFIFNTLLLDKSTDDRLRKYPHWLAARNLSNEASDEAVEALVDAVVSRYDIPQRFYRLKARLLGLDRLADYDRLAPISETPEHVPWDEARSLVTQAYQDFAPQAGKIIGDFFEKNWIDAALGPNKRHGAFCSTLVPGVHPYVMMNYTGERRSVLVLAHELGHGLHGYLAQDQGLINASTPITLAETASVFGEALTFRKLMEGETDKQRRLELLMARVDDAVTTVFRQIAFNRFEDAVHNARRNDGELAPETFSKFWLETQRNLLADSVEFTDGYELWWSHVPHFVQMPGYVYGYSFGYLFSLAIYSRYEQEGASMVEPYLDLLRAGGSDRPEVLAKIVGLDITDPGFWKGGLEAVDAVLAEAESLA